MSLRPVRITGLGLATPWGGTAASLDALTTRRIVPCQPLSALAGTPLAQVLAAPALIDESRRASLGRVRKYLAPAGVLACLAADEALAEAGLPGRLAPERIGLYAASGLASASWTEIAPLAEASVGADGAFDCRRLGSHGLAACNPLLSFRILPNMAACILSIRHGLTGPNLLFNPWEGQASAALHEAWWAVATGLVDAALAGGADTPAAPLAMLHLHGQGLLPADQWTADAAAFVVLEAAASLGHARLRSVELLPGQADDPLAASLGRSLAAAPAAALALAAWRCSSPVELRVGGVDPVVGIFQVEPPA